MLVVRGNCVGVAEAAVEGDQTEPELVDSEHTNACILQCRRHSLERSQKTTSFAFQKCSRV